VATAKGSDFECYLALDGKEKGPFTIGQVRSMWQAGSITSRTLYFEPTMKGWKPLALVSSLIEDAAHGGQTRPVLVKEDAKDDEDPRDLAGFDEHGTSLSSMGSILDQGADQRQWFPAFMVGSK